MAVTFQDYFETLDATGHKVALANQWIRLMPTGGGAGVLSDAKTDPQGRCQFTAAPQGIPLTVEYSDTGVGGAGTAIGTAPWVATGDTAYFAPGGAGGGGGTIATEGDLVLAGLADRDLIVWDAAAAKWKNRQPPAAYASPPMEALRVHIGAPVPGHTGGTVPFDTVDQDTAGGFNTGTHAYTVKRAGRYFFSCEVELNAAFNGRLLVTLQNLTSGDACRGNDLTENSYFGALAMGFFECQAGDQIAVSTYTGGGAVVLDVPTHLRGFQIPSAVTLVTGGGGDQVWTPVAYSGTWVDFDGAHAAAYRKDALGFVHLRGLVKSGASGTTITTLPLGYRPDEEVTCLQSRDAAATAMRVWIEPTGAVVPEAVVVASYLSLDGISFYAGPPTAVGLSSANEDLASILVNATSVGDAGNRSDQFLGSVLGGPWVPYGSASTIVVRDSALGLLNAGASSDGGVRQVYTPSGAFRVETRVRSGQLEIGGAALSGGAPSDAIVVDSPDTGANGCQMSHRTAGAFAILATSGVTVAPGTPLYLAIERDGANDWTAYWSLDRALWVALATVTQVIGVGYIYLARFGAGVPHSHDFLDVVS